MTPILELRNVAKQYAAHRAVEAVSLEVPGGSFYSLLGPSGCGKTTTLRMIAGFEQPTEGEILLEGKCVNDRRPYERNVSTVFQSYALFPHLTVQGNVEFGLKRKSVTDIESRAREALALVELTGKESRLPAQLSGGERQRVALARSLVLNPGVLLLDEPLAALDPKLRKQMRLELKQLQTRVGTTFLFVTHDQEEALSMSDRIAVMNAGRVEQIGTPREIYLEPRTRFVATFIGAVNWVDNIGVRPESVQLSRTALTGEMQSRPAKVVAPVFLGTCVQVHTRLSTGEEVIAELPRSDSDFQPGDSVYVAWNRSDEMKFP